MELNRSKWYVRWYFWSLGICDVFFDYHSLTWRAEEKGTNLCAFMRVILIYAPLILLLHAIVYAGALATVTILPIKLFGLKGYGLSVGAIVVLCLVVFTTVSLVMSLKEKRQTARTLGQEQAAKPTNADATDPGFFRVLGQWVVAKKRKVCPLVTFVERDKEDVQ